MINEPATVLSTESFSLDVATTPYRVPTASDGMVTLSLEIAE